MSDWMKECFCKACGAEIYRIKPYTQRRSIPVNREELWIKKDVKGQCYTMENGASVFGYPVGDSYDDDTNLVKAYESHLATCPFGGRAPRKPRDRVKSDLRQGYNFESHDFK